MPDRFDVVVAGGGPVGAALALALRGSGLAVALVEPHDADRGGDSAPFRPIALAYASRLFLERIGGFAALPVTPIQTVHISQAGGFGRTLISAAELDVPSLGYVTDLAPLARSLLAAAAPEHCAARVAGWEESRDTVRVRLAGGEPELDARLLVLADGGRSAGDDLSLRDHGQTAIVAAVRPARVAPGTAFERFTAEGPAALLPYDDRYALIWSVGTGRAPALMSAPDAEFMAEISALFGPRLGCFLEVGARAAHPLGLRFRRASAVGARVVAIGNAAQILHPVAGQGLNLGLRDAAELAEEIRAPGRAALESGAVAGRFAARRSGDRRASIGITEGLVRAFGIDHPAARALRGIALAALDVLPPARKLIARRFVFGLRALP